MTHSSINIVYCTDDNYAEPCCVSMASVLASTQESINFYIVYNSLTVANMSKIKALKSKFANGEIDFVPFDFTIPENFVLTGKKNSSVEVYFRLWFGELFSNLSRIIFFDCDVIVRGDIKEMWMLDLGDKTIGAVTEISNFFPGVTTLLNEAGFPKTYFCAGVMLINLEEYRRLNIPKRSVELVPQLIARNNLAGRNFHCDQDILNEILFTAHKIMLLPPKFQFQDNNYNFNNPLDFELMSFSDWVEAFRNPLVVHFNAMRKPWIINNTFQAAYLWKEYFKYKRYTEYFDSTDEKWIIEYEHRRKQTLMSFDIENNKNLDYSLHFWRELLNESAEMIKRKSKGRKVCYWGKTRYLTQFMTVLAANGVYPDIIVDGLEINCGVQIDKWIVQKSDIIAEKASQYFVVSFISSLVIRNEVKTIFSDCGYSTNDYLQIFDLWDEKANMPISLSF